MEFASFHQSREPLIQRRPLWYFACTTDAPHLQHCPSQVCFAFSLQDLTLPHNCLEYLWFQDELKILNLEYKFPKTWSGLQPQILLVTYLLSLCHTNPGISFLNVSAEWVPSPEWLIQKSTCKQMGEHVISQNSGVRLGDGIHHQGVSQLEEVTGEPRSAGVEGGASRWGVWPTRQQKAAQCTVDVDLPHNTWRF